MLYSEVLDMFEGVSDDVHMSNWNDTGKLCVLAEFVVEQGLAEKFRDFIARKAADEQEILADEAAGGDEEDGDEEDCSDDDVCICGRKVDEEGCCPVCDADYDSGIDDDDDYGDTSCPLCGEEMGPDGSCDDCDN